MIVKITGTPIGIHAPTLAMRWLNKLVVNAQIVNDKIMVTTAEIAAAIRRKDSSAKAPAEFWEQSASIENLTFAKNDCEIVK